MIVNILNVRFNVQKNELLLFFILDDDDLTQTKLHVMNLGDEYGSHCLIKCCAVHGQYGCYWQNKACHSFVHVEVVLQTADGDGQGHRTGKNIPFVQILE